MGNSNAASGNYTASIAMNQSSIRLARTKAMMESTVKQYRTELEQAVREGDKHKIEAAVTALAVAMVDCNRMATMISTTQNMRRRMELARALAESAEAMKVASEAIREALPNGASMAEAHESASNLFVDLEASTATMSQFSAGLNVTTSTETTDAVKEMVVAIRKQYELELADQMGGLPVPPKGFGDDRVVVHEEHERKHE